jgi:cytochrome c2
MVLSGNVTVNYDDKVHVYDAGKNSWSTMQLSEARGYMAAATTGNIVMFGGGVNMNNMSSKVDIYNTSTNAWTTANLSEARNNLVAAAAGNKIVFAGGNNSKSGSESKVVDIYDIVTNSWTTAQLSEAKLGMCAAAAGNKIMFAGGYVYDRTNGTHIYSKTIDIYDVSTGKWSTAELSEPKSAFAAAASGNKIVFAGGINEAGIALKSVDIFTIK